MLTLIEKAEKTLDEEQTRKLEKKLRHGTLDLEDFLGQLEQVQKMGPLTQLMEMIPGLSAIARRAPIEVDERKIKRIKAIILSMTPEERRNPDIIDGSRKRRIARGSGTTSQDVNQLLNQFRQTQKLVKQMASARGKIRLDMLR
jgi:signal recognition particle subunit SRP54